MVEDSLLWYYFITYSGCGFLVKKLWDSLTKKKTGAEGAKGHGRRHLRTLGLRKLGQYIYILLLLVLVLFY